MLWLLFFSGITDITHMYSLSAFVDSQVSIPATDIEDLAEEGGEEGQHNSRKHWRKVASFICVWHDSVACTCSTSFMHVV